MLPLLAPLVAPSTPGCVVPTATNYDPSASVHDHSCVYARRGCTDRSKLNYASGATEDDGSCVERVHGCTHHRATNYDPKANVADGSCRYSASTATGCTSQLASNYDERAVVDDGSCSYAVAGCTDHKALNYLPGATVAGACRFAGCTDAGSWRFDATATVDDGSCVHAKVLAEKEAAERAARLRRPADIVGCADRHAASYRPEVTLADASHCLYVGCTSQIGRAHV